MAITRLSPTATFVTRGYGQVEVQHLSAQRTGQIYAQLPADGAINVLENGQFAKYDYAAGKVNYTGKGEWMLVLNEVKLYRDREQYEDFAMVKQNYNARVYSPIGQDSSDIVGVMDYKGEAFREGSSIDYKIGVPKFNYPQEMPEGTKMVPRLVKTNVGDIFTTNTIVAEPGSLEVGAVLCVGDNGYLVDEGSAGSNAGTMRWQVAKVYTLADNQPAVKIQRIA